MKRLNDYARKPKITGDLKGDIERYLSPDFDTTATHLINVSECAKQLAERFGEDPELAEQGGLLHDISVVIPENKRIEVADDLAIPLVLEEQKLPMIIHQKLSRVIAEEFFLIKDPFVLSAIECHTTLKRNPTKMDQIVFLADKIRWDQAGTPPYLTELLRALDVSLERASLVYLNYLLTSDLLVVHPWAKEAHEWLEKQV